MAMGSITGTTGVQRCAPKNGTPWFWNEIEAKCETCSTNVCRVLRYPPEACRCFCFHKLPSDEYSVTGRECGGASFNHIDKGAPSPEASLPVGWMVFAIVIVPLIVIGLVVLVVNRKKVKSKLEKYFQKQSVSTITMVRFEPWIPPSADAPGNAPPIVPPSLQTTSRQPENHPTQVSENNIQRGQKEETNAKTALIEDGLPRQAVGPSYPSEGAPGGKYQLLPQHDNIG